MLTRFKNPKVFLPVAATILLVLIATTVCSAIWGFRWLAAFYQRERERDELILRDLSVEFDALVPPSTDIRVRKGQTAGLVSADYKSTLSSSEIKSNYHEQFVRRGWRFVREAPVIYDGHDYGGTEVNYCKGSYAASLFLAGGLERQFGWTYGISLSSGLHQECK